MSKSVVWGLALALGVAAGAAQAASGSAALVGYGFSVSAGYSDTGTAFDTASVSNGGFFAAFGPNPLGQPASSGYPIRYSGMAEANAGAGVLRARIDADRLANVLPRGGEAQASYTGSFNLVGANPGDPVLFVLSLRVDGTVQGEAGVEGSLRVQSATNPSQVWTASYTSPSQVSSFAWGVDHTVSLSVFGTSGDQFLVTETLRAWANTSLQSHSVSDFSHSMTLTLVPQGHTRLVGIDGFLASAAVQSPVPEPGSAALLALGLAPLAWLAARRRRA